MDISTGITHATSVPSTFNAEPSPPISIGVLQTLTLITDQAMEPVDLAKGFTGANLSFALAPGSDALPTGLVLSLSGALSGTPIAQAVPLNIIVRASNIHGSSDDEFTLSVQNMLISFTATLSGATDNSTYGLTAQSGEVLTAVASGFSDVAPDAISYQWRTQNGAIVGATAATYAPSASLLDGETLTCVISAAPYPDTETNPLVVRYAPPVEASGDVFPVIFEQETGVQDEPFAQDFTGEAMVFQISGVGAAINAATGIASFPTDVLRDSEPVTVTATNSGGSAERLYLVTVEPEAEADLVETFGALTLAGAGGISVGGSSIALGDPSGHWQISGGRLSPSANGAGNLAGPYSLALNNGETIDVSLLADIYSCRTASELTAAFTSAPASAQGILLRDGDYTSAGRLSFSSKVFANPFTIEPHDWGEGTDPRNTTRNVVLPGISFAGGCGNITIQGCEIYANDASVGVIQIERPSENIIVRQNEIRSAALLGEYSSGRMAAGAMTTIEGVADGLGNGLHTRLKIDENYIHDVTRGAELLNVTDNANGPSSITGNIFEDCYQFFTLASGITTSVGAIGAEIYDNTGLHVWSTTADSGAPHSSVGLSFDADINGLNVMGNLVHVGHNRIVAEPGFVTGATGAKFNNPNVSDSYQNITFAFNTIVSHGLCIEFAGADGIDVFNNTVISEDQLGGTLATISFEGAANVRMWNNIAENYQIGSYDGIGDKGGTPVFGKTLDTLRGYGNIATDDGATDFGRNTIFAGASGGFDNLDIDQLVTAFTPKAGAYPLIATEKKGALGTGYYAGNGVHTAPAFSDRVATGGTPYASALTTWDGSQFASKTGGLASVSNGKEVTIAWEGALHADMDGTDFYLFHEIGSRISLRHLPTNKLRFRVEAADGSVAYSGDTEEKLESANGLVRLAFSLDLANGRGVFVRDGKTSALTPVGSDGPMQNADIAWTSLSTCFIGTNSGSGAKFKGNFGGLLVMDEFVDLDTVAGLNQLFDGTGAFRDWGDDGSNISPGAKPLVYRRNAAFLNSGMGNGGNGGVFTMTGTVTDAVIVTDLLDGVGDFSDATGWSLGAGLTVSGGVLNADTGANFQNAARLGGHKISANPNTNLSLQFSALNLTTAQRLRIGLRPFDSGGSPIEALSQVYDSAADGAVTAGMNSKPNAFTTPAGTASLEVVIEFTIAGFSGQLDDLKLLEG